MNALSYCLYTSNIKKCTKNIVVVKVTMLEEGIERGRT